MIYEQYAIGGELMHSAKGVEWKNKKYIDKVKTKSGKWRYIYKNTGLYKAYKGLRRKAKYAMDFRKNKKDAADLKKSAEENRTSAEMYRENVKDLDQAQKYFGVKNYDEPTRQRKLESARNLERVADSQEKAAAEAKRKMEQSPQYQLRKSAVNMATEAVQDVLDDLGYEIDEGTVSELLAYLGIKKKK